jgi:hypothetical protein
MNCTAYQNPQSNVGFFKNMQRAEEKGIKRRSCKLKDR